MCRCVKCIKEINQMIKMSLLSCVAIVLLTVSCVRSIDHSESPTIRIQEANNYTVTIHNSVNFVENYEYQVCALIGACFEAGFESDQYVHESINPDVYVISIYADHGYASLWVDTKKGSCVLEYFCSDEHYNYEHFLERFIQEFQESLPKREWFEEIYDSLEEEWNQ